MKNRTVSVFHCPTALYEEVKVISEKEMISYLHFVEWQLILWSKIIVSANNLPKVLRRITQI